MQLSYDLEMQTAIAGALADASVKVTDSYRAEGEDGIAPGVPVIAGTGSNQVKAVTASGEAASVIGVAQHAHKSLSDSTSEPYYPEGYVLPVLTRGRIWVAVDDTEISANTDAYYDYDNAIWSASAGEAVADAKFVSAAENGYAVVAFR